jgi:hypothetical protein
MAQILNKTFDNVKQITLDNNLVNYDQVIIYRSIYDTYYRLNVYIREFTVELRNNNIVVGTDVMLLFVIHGVLNDTDLTRNISRYL